MAHIGALHTGPEIRIQCRSRSFSVDHFASTWANSDIDPDLTWQFAVVVMLSDKRPHWSWSCLSQWVWFSLSTRSFIGSDQNSAHPYYNVVDRAFSNYAGQLREHRVLRYASVRKRNLREWRTPRDEFGFLNWSIHFYKGCNYSNETNGMM